MNRRILLATALIIFSLTLASCGYRFTGDGEGPKPGLKFIAIPVFENKTSEPDLGAIVAGALRQEFLRKGNMKVVPADEAEAVFIGTVTSIQAHSVAHRPSDVVSDRITVENRLYITLDIRCEEKTTRKVLWRDPSFQYHKVYRLSGISSQPDGLSGFENRRNALDFLAREMAVRIHDRFLSNF
ncbi:MAG: LPS assembly lipoprotein LptE [Syntrophobacteraceae bacterium]